MGETLAIIEPATEAVLEEIPRAGVEQVDEAVARAQRGVPRVAGDGTGGAGAAAARGRRRGRRATRDELALLEARNAGKPIGDARGEIGMVVDTFRYYAGAPERLLGDTIPVAGGQAFTVREPLGVVGLIVPWNFPLTIAAWKLGPALAAGNTVVLKPAELTPLTALRFAELALEAGLPEGVVNVVVGPGRTCGQRLVEHPDVAKIAFTGSTEVGRMIATAAASTIKRVTLELGGKSPNIVFADADLEAAAAAAPMAVFGNAGQDCCARSRLLVQASVLDKFMALLEPAVQAVRVGDPLEPTSQMGPLISAAQRETVASFVADDAPVAIRGSAPEGPGFWFAPTVLCPVEPDARAVREEIFGPVVTVIPFQDEADAVRLANDTIYGLSGLDLDARRSQGAARRPGAGGGRAVDQLQHLRAGGDSVRGLQAIGLRPRARPARARRLHRSQVDLLRGPHEWAPEGRVCVITGAAGGIGAATSELFAREGAHVVGVDLREHSTGELSLQADLTEEAAVAALYERARERARPRRRALQQCRHLTERRRLGAGHVAGGLGAGPGGQPAQRVPVLQARDPPPARSGGGSVINTASFVAVMGAATSQISYTASKGAVLSLSRELGVEFARRGVRVNALCPGPVDTPLLRELYAKDPEQAARRLVHVPMGRFARAEEIANAVLFLASDESSYVTAATFLVDGGISGAYTTPGSERPRERHKGHIVVLYVEHHGARQHGAQGVVALGRGPPGEGCDPELRGPGARAATSSSGRTATRRPARAARGSRSRRAGSRPRARSRTP